MIAIGALSERTGVHIETIRYYERAGVLPKPQRSPSGRRTYRDDDVRRLLLIKHSRELGFELKTVRALLSLQGQPKCSCKSASRLAEAQLAVIESRIARLKELRRELSGLVKSCKNGHVADCSVIAGLARPELRSPR